MSRFDEVTRVTGRAETVFFVRKLGEGAGVPDSMCVPLGTAEKHVSYDLITCIVPKRPIEQPPKGGGQ